MSDGGSDLARARSEAASLRDASESERAAHRARVDDALRKQDERASQLIHEFLETTRGEGVEPRDIYTGRWEQVGTERRLFRRARPKYESVHVSGHYVWGHYEDECTTRSILVLTSGHILFATGYRDYRTDGVERFGDYWRRGGGCCHGEFPFHLSRGARGRPEVGQRDAAWESWPTAEVVDKLGQTMTWFARTLAEYLERRTLDRTEHSG